MTFAISKAKAESMVERANRAIAYAKNIREQSKEQVAQVVTSAEIQGAAFLMGLVDGRWQNPKILGIPAALIVGLALHTAGFAGFGGSRDADLHALGDGALAAYSVGLGNEVGTRMRTRTTTPAGGAASGGREMSIADIIDAATS